MKWLTNTMLEALASGWCKRKGLNSLEFTSLPLGWYFPKHLFESSLSVGDQRCAIYYRN